MGLSQDRHLEARFKVQIAFHIPVCTQVNPVVHPRQCRRQQDQALDVEPSQCPATQVILVWTAILASGLALVQMAINAGHKIMVVLHLRVGDLD